MIHHVIHVYMRHNDDNVTWDLSSMYIIHHPCISWMISMDEKAHVITHVNPLDSSGILGDASLLVTGYRLHVASSLPK